MKELFTRDEVISFMILLNKQINFTSDGLGLSDRGLESWINKYLK